LIAQSVQVFEKAPEHHAPVILSAGALDEGEPSLDALKLLFDGPHGSLPFLEPRMTKGQTAEGELFSTWVER
jgi:hypothetical protein